jgi:hypothetical protein
MESVYVDLVKNKESYTAFDGMQIWQAIYKDNCMVEPQRSDGVDVSKTCTDSTLLYQLVSGLHASINTHVAFNFVDDYTPTSRRDEDDSQYPLRDDGKDESLKATPNYQVFLRTVGMDPTRVKNLYLLYSLVVKAIHKAENAYRGVDYSPEDITGAKEKSRVLIADLVRVSM